MQVKNDNGLNVDKAMETLAEVFNAQFRGITKPVESEKLKTFFRACFSQDGQQLARAFMDLPAEMQRAVNYGFETAIQNLTWMSKVVYFLEAPPVPQLLISRRVRRSGKKQGAKTAGGRALKATTTSRPRKVKK